MHWVPGSLGQILGFVFAPVAWLIGVPWHDCGAIGNLLGTRMALNEVIAYISLGTQKAMLAPRSFIIATFALCGFANLGSIGMQIGGIGALVPERCNDLADLGGAVGGDSAVIIDCVFRPGGRRKSGLS